MSRFAVILPAAGRSSRFGGLEKKPFVSLEGRPVWQRAAELFWNRDDVSEVLIVIDPADRDDFRSRFGHLIAFTNAKLVDGGSERFESVYKALEQLPEEVEFVAVHDAVRPLTPPAVVDAVFAKAKETGAAIVGLPVADTLKQAEPKEKVIGRTVPRHNLWRAQTPQVFRRDWLIEAYRRRAEIAEPITDDAQLVEALGHAVSIVDGAEENFKITTKSDLQLATAILNGRDKKQESSRPTLGFRDEAQW